MYRRQFLGLRLCRQTIRHTLPFSREMVYGAPRLRVFVDFEFGLKRPRWKVRDLCRILFFAILAVARYGRRNGPRQKGRQRRHHEQGAESELKITAHGRILAVFSESVDFNLAQEFM